MRIALVLLAACGSTAAPVVAPSNTTGPTSAPTVAPAAPANDEDLRALREIDDANPRSVDKAQKAATALGEAGGARGIDELAALALRPPTKQLISAEVAAIRALGKRKQQPKAVDALIAVAARELPPRPLDHAMEDAYALALATAGAAVNALAEQGDPRATSTLVKLIYVAPELTSQLRRAFAAFGPEPVKQLVDVIDGKHAEVEALFKAKRLDQACDPQGNCQPLASRDFYAALVLGDLHAERAVPALLGALTRPPLPVYLYDGELSPNTQYDAIFDALRKIGQAQTAPLVRKIWSDPKQPAALRSLAAATYGFVVPDTAGAEALWAIAADNSADDTLRTEAATAFARITSDKQHAARFTTLATKYIDASAKKRAAADKGLAKKQQADTELDKVKDSLDRAKSKLIALTQDPAATADQIRAGTETAKRADADFKAAKTKHREKTMPWRQNDMAASAYLAYARMFQSHVARVELASRCAADTKCYAAAIALDVNAAVALVKPLLPGVETWTEEQKQALVEAYADRALLELGKRKATDQLDAVLAGLASENRFVREAILLVLPKLAPSPCPACITKLDAAIESGVGKTHLAALQIETEVLRNYLRSR
jgi:hypothetical protein